MTEIERIEDQMRRSFTGEAWHGPAVDELLADTVPGRSDSFYDNLHGIIQHDLFHAGQIVLLRRGGRATAAPSADPTPEVRR